MAQLVGKIAIDSAIGNFLPNFLDAELPRRLAEQVLSGEAEYTKANIIDPTRINSPIAVVGGWQAKHDDGKVRAPSADESWVVEFYKDGNDGWAELRPKILGQGETPIRIPLKDRVNFTPEMTSNIDGLHWVHRGICAGLATLLGAEGASPHNRLGPEAWDEVANLKTALYVLQGGSRSIAKNLESLQAIPELDGLLALIGQMDTASRSDLLWTQALVERGYQFHVGNEFKRYEMHVGCGAEPLNSEQLQRSAVINGHLKPEEFVQAKLIQLKRAQEMGLGRVCFPSATLDGLPSEILIDIHRQLHGDETDVRKRAGLHALGDNFVPGTGYFEGDAGAEVLRAVMGQYAYLKTSIPDMNAQLRYLDLAKETDGRILTGDDYNTALVLGIGAKRLADELMRGGSYEVRNLNGRLYIDSPTMPGGLLGNINISPRQFAGGMYYLSMYVKEAAAGNTLLAKDHLIQFFDIWVGYTAASILSFFGPRNPTRSYTGYMEASYRLRGVLDDNDKGHVLPLRDYFWKDDISRKLTDASVLLMLAFAREATIEDVQKIIAVNKDRLIVV